MFTIYDHNFPLTGEQIQENAYVIVRLLIHHPECLGPALAGEAIGLHQVYEDVLDHMQDTPQYGSSWASPRDTSDLGSALPLRGSPSRGDSSADSPPGDYHSALRHRSSSYLNLNLMSTQLVLSFYTSLVRLLAYCAPVDDDGSPSGTTSGLGGPTSGQNGSPGGRNGPTSGQNGSPGGRNGPTSGQNGSAGGHNGTAGGTKDASNVNKNGAERTRNILKNLVSVGDLRGILSLPFARDGQKGIVPAHKEAVLLFLSRVYAVSQPELLRDLLTDAFLPDIKTALKLASVSALMFLV